MHLPRKRRRLIIDSDSETDSIENFVLNNLLTTNNAQKWKNPTGHQARVIPFTEPTGMKLPYSARLNQANPKDFYALMVPDGLFEIIADETNIFAAQSLSERDLKPSSQSHG